MTLAAAITGRAPLYGMFLDENRRGEVLVRFEGVDVGELTPAQLGAVGYHVGAIAGSRNVVMEGVPADIDLDRLKLLLAPLPVSGAVCLCHVVGVTPEAPTLEAALGGREPQETVVVRPEDIRRSLAAFVGDGSAKADLAIFGCPHCTVHEVKTLAGLLSGRRLASGKRLWIGMPRQFHPLVTDMGYAAPIEAAGGVFASSCMATIPDAPLPEGVRVVATNSFKAAHYIVRLTKGRVKVLLEDMDRCVDAVCGARQGGAA
jgi:predicted aconitase